MAKTVKRKRKKVNLELPLNLYMYLQELADNSGVSRDDVINVILAAKIMSLTSVEKNT